MAAEPNKEVFVVSAIGGDDSPQRIHADWLLEGIIDPVFQTHFQDFTVLRADRIGTPGLIDAQIIGKLLTSRLVIADLTFLNPNAFYEIGIRHVVNLPIIHVHRTDQNIPFDISLFRSIKYSTERPQHLVAAQATLTRTVEEVLAADYTVENPVTQARGRAQFEQTATPADKVLERQLEAVEQRLLGLEQFRHSIAHADARVEYKRRVLVPTPSQMRSSLVISRKNDSHPQSLRAFAEIVLPGFLGEEVQLVSQTDEELEITYPGGAISPEYIKDLAAEAHRRGLWASPA